MQTNVTHLLYDVFLCVRLNMDSQMGYMPIHCAAAKGSLPLVKYFINLGVDVNTKTKVSIVKIVRLFILC